MREKNLEEMLIATSIGALAAHEACAVLPYMQGPGIVTTIVFVIFWALGMTIAWHAISGLQMIKRKLPRLLAQLKGRKTKTLYL